ncbi:hypothetical protein SB49_14215 [Sediminicola sp. YIK13]|uniref:YobI family P-loop NTPase n=1 Tax=Sediminicola sp. YIK13 TaxID=1453352 RepID=UPI00072187AC|nr:hypothetical protein [Sediminicola sp. YIK13]ALM08821.1 hypothetical protein SB49_14215 [Sediminicola sp. YIK13]
MNEPSKKTNQNSSSTSDKDSSIKNFISKLKKLRYSFVQIFFQEKDKAEPISSLAAKVLKSKKEIEKIQPYLNRLNSALSSEDVTNIALTGTYGSGKSTVIKTFQDIYKAEDPNNDFKYLNISLASFKDEILDEEDESKKENKNEESSNGIKNALLSKRHKDFEKLLEVSILQQMIYHVKPSRIPDSRFKRIVNFTKWKLIITSISFVIWLISAFSMWQFNVFSKINPFAWTFSSKDLDFTSLIIISIFLSGLSKIIYSLIRTFGNSRISKINIKGELELGEKVDKSILNQHLDEIIYYFQRTEFNVVVIEDLDRFKDTEIFTKLREINLLLNNSELIRRKIVFVYAIRDDMFQGNERIKFFDYIIPVIPFINPSNANDKLTELLKEEDLISVFSQSFIDDVVTFIDDIDMRLLTNILQEYLVYKESLTHELTQDNLLAIVIYKNIYPRDFAKLHKNEGDLFDFISNKATYVNDMISKLDEEIATNIPLISGLQNEKIKNEKELKEVYLFNIISQLDNPSDIFIEGKPVPLNKLLEQDNFNSLINEQNINYNTLIINRSYNMYTKTKKSLDKSFSDIEREINKFHKFNERIEHINNNNDNRLEELKEQNELLKERKEEIKRWNIKNIFQNQDVSVYLGPFMGSLLMRSLLVNGYINENYLDYISLFHEVNITKGDYTFIRKVKIGESLDFNYKIEKLENLIKKIDESHFEKVAILNHQVIEFILKNKNQYKSRYESLKKLLKSENQKVIDFIDRFKRSEQTDNKILFKELPSIWQGFWNFITTKGKFSEKKTNEYLQLIVTHANLADIKNFNNIKSFKQHFSILSNLADLVKDKDQTEKLKSIIESFKIKFDNISELNYNNEFLYDYVLTNDSYEIKYTNLLAITTDEGKSEEDFRSSNYTTLRHLENKLPLAYIEKNIETYVTNVFLTLENTKETEDALISLLNNSDLIIPTRKLILETTATVFQNLSDFDDIEIKEEILKQLAVNTSWVNVMDYFNSYTKENLDSILINYLDNDDVYNELGKSNLSSLKDDNEVKKKLALAIIYCDELSLESHTKLRTCKSSGWTGLVLKGLSSDKVKSMIESKFFTLSVEYYDKVKEEFPGLHINLIEKSFITYIKNYAAYEMNEEDHSSIMQSIVLRDAQKKEFLNTLDENEIIEDAVIASSATKVYVNEKVSNLSYSLLYGLFKGSSSNEYRIQLFNLNSNNIDKTQAKNLIGQLGHPYNRLIKSRKQAKIAINPINLEFTNNLMSLGIITSNREVRGMIKAVASA